VIARSVIRAEWVGLFVAVLVFVSVMSVSVPPFNTEINQYVVLLNLSVILIVAFAQMIVLAIGHMNLSIGAMGGLVAVIVGALMERWGVPIPIAILVGIGCGGLMGLTNAVVTIRTGINPFIVTIATASVFSGINLAITGGIPLYRLPADFVAFGQARTGPLPHLLIGTILIGLVLAVLLRTTVFGRQLLALGGNARAAELSGLPVTRLIIGAHVLSGMIVAVAAVLLMARLGSGQPTIGSTWLLPSFAGPIIGGASLTGGAVSVIGTSLATGLVTLIENALVLVQADPFWVEFLLGALILGAIGLSRFRSLYAGRRPIRPKPLRPITGLSEP
jgi:ribose transport system permease protein